MKKFIAILMTLLMLLSFTALSVGAADAAETAVSVEKGDEVVYSLNLSVPEKVVGCDFSIYYDSSQLKVKEVADFNGSYNVDDHQALINSNLNNEVRGNWSILSGVRFDNKSVCKVKFEAVKDTDAHVSYYVRYLYPESLEQFTDYTFTCDVDVNSKTVINDAAPELNVDEEQSDGLFVNSVTGSGDDADVNTAEKDVTPEKSEKDVKNDKDDKQDSTQLNVAESQNAGKDTDAQTTSTIGGADGPTDIVVATPSQTDGGIFSSVWFWTMIAIVVIGAGCAVYFLKFKKKSDPTDAE